MSRPDPTSRRGTPIADELDPPLDDRRLERVWRRLDAEQPGPRLSTPLMWAAAACLALLLGLVWWRDINPHAPGSGAETAQSGFAARARPITPESAIRAGVTGRPDPTASDVAVPGAAIPGAATPHAASDRTEPTPAADPRQVAAEEAPNGKPGPVLRATTSAGRPQLPPAPQPHRERAADPPSVSAVERDAAPVQRAPAPDALRDGATPSGDAIAASPGLLEDPLTAIGRIFDEYGPSATGSTVLLGMSHALAPSQPAYAARLLERGMARGFPPNPAMHVLASDAWAAAGQPARAARAARRALRGAPEGPHAERMRRRSVPENAPR